jgi:periplasmic divalent cation tolerance protein
MEFNHLVVQSSFPDEAAARTAAQTLVTERLAACAQIWPCRSVFRWNGAVQEESEVLLQLKTVAGCWPRLEARIRLLHPYQVPEIIALPIVAGSTDYVKWLEAETGDERDAATQDP